MSPATAAVNLGAIYAPRVDAAIRAIAANAKDKRKAKAGEGK
jgi:hypothetical protein